MSCVSLHRDEALHVLAEHYTYANWSICQFADHSHVTYVTDLVWEIDAHAGPLTVMADHAYYVPAIRAAVEVGRRIFDFLTEELDVAPGYITTSVTRMGARVTVDWRAVGPRTLAQCLAVIRYVQTQAVSPDDLKSLTVELREAITAETERISRAFDLDVWPEDDPTPIPDIKATVEVDNIYRVSDRVTRSRHKGHRFKGPLTRPPGALHTASSPAAMWIRITPVPHERFRPENAEWLTQVSRSSSPDLERFSEPDLYAYPWPETRHPASHARVEALPPAHGLCFVADQWRTLDLPPAYRAEVTTQERRSRPIDLRRDAVAGDLSADEITKIVEALQPEDIRHTSSQIKMTCPYCRDASNSATVYLESGVFTCPRLKCGVGGRHITGVALDHGLAHLVPWRRPSSVLLRRDQPPVCDPTRITWDIVGNVHKATYPAVDIARSWLRHQLDDALTRSDWTVLVVQGPTGVGKTTTVLDALRRHGVVIRGAFPRDESRMDLVDAYEPDLPTRVIDGRRDHNCAQFDRLGMIQDRGLPPRLVCNRQCPDRDGCSYLEQFEDIEGVSLAISHGHLPHLDLKRLDNGSEVTLIDENPLGASTEVIMLDGRELDRLRLALDPVADEWGDVSLEGPHTRVGVTPAIEDLISWLEVALTKEAMSECPTVIGDARSKRKGRDIVGDLALATHWMADGVLPAIIDRIDQHGLEQHEAAVYNAAERYLDDEDDTAPVPPRACLGDLVAALRQLYHLHAAGMQRPSRLCVANEGTHWSIRLTQRRNLQHGRTIILSSTMTATQFLMAYGDVPGVEVIQPEVEQKERRIIVADRQLGADRLAEPSKPKDKKLQAVVFETAAKLIERERERTGLPVALLGRAKVLNAFLAVILGRPLPSRLRMPHSGGERAERASDLRELTEPHGILAGYAGGVSGSNAFAVEDEDTGVTRFVRSTIVLGGILPNLGNVEADWRGAFADFPWRDQDGARVDRLVDWSVVPREVVYEGTELGDDPEARTAVSATNVYGYASTEANEVLRHAYEDELIQMVGRMRGCIPDPVDPSIEPRAYILGHIAIPGWGVTGPEDVVTLDELRGQLGLAPAAGKGRRGQRVVIDRSPEALAKAIKANRGRTIRRLARALVEAEFFPVGYGKVKGVVLEVERRVRECGSKWSDKDRDRAIEAAKSALLKAEKGSDEISGT